MFSEAKFWLKMFITVPSILVFSFFAVLWCYFKWTNRHFNRLAAKLNGPPGYPIIGSMLEFVGPHIRMQQIQIHKTIRVKCHKILLYRQFVSFFFLGLLDTIIKLSNDYGPEPFKMWCGPYFTVCISKPEDVQVIHLPTC